MPMNDPHEYLCLDCDYPSGNKDWKPIDCPRCNSKDLVRVYGPPTKTQWMHQRIKDLPDDDKLFFCINWRIPHSLFNVACKLWPLEYQAGHLEGIDWFAIHKSRDVGYWSNGFGAVPFASA